MKFSVLMSVYKNDNSSYLYDAIESILAQSLSPSEIVIIIDGPVSLELKNVTNTFVLRRSDIFKVHQLDNNVGLGMALNFGVRICENEIIARMDSDDISVYDRFEKQIDFLQKNPNISVVGGQIHEFKYNIREKGNFRLLPCSSSAIFTFSKKRNPLNHPTVMFRKKDILDAGSYIDMPFFEDYYLWVRLLKKGYSLANIPEVLIHFRFSQNTLDRRIGSKYILYEYNFFKKLLFMNYITFFNFIFLLLIRLPFRILPVSLFKNIYFLLLREKKLK